MRIGLDGRRRVTFIGGLALIAVGACLLITDSHGSGAVASLFTIAGLVISFLQLFLVAPEAAKADSSANPGTTVITGTGEAVLSEGQPRSAQPGTGTIVSLIPAAAFFLAGPLIAAADFITLQGISTIHPFRITAILELLGFTIAIFAYVGFYSLQAPRMLILTSVTTVLTISSLTLNIVQDFLTLVFLEPGQHLPSAALTLFHYNIYLVAIADILIAVTVFLCKRFAVWTTWVWLAIAGCDLLGLKFPYSRAFQVVTAISGIALCVVYVTFGVRLARADRG